MGLGSDEKYSWTSAAPADIRWLGTTFISLEARSPALRDGESLEKRKTEGEKKEEEGERRWATREGEDEGEEEGKEGTKLNINT